MSGAERVPRIYEWVALLVLVVSAIAPLFNLQASSLWIDELFSAYFSDPDQSLNQAMLRAAEDVHPPTYYVLLYAFRSVIDGPVEVVGRALSGILSIISLIILWLAARRFLSRWASLIAVLSLTTSAVYFRSSIELRSYSLLWVFVSSSLFFAVRYLQESPSAKWGLALSLIIASYIHSYALFLSATICACMILREESWKSRGFWIALGTIILLGELALLNWQNPLMVLDPAKSWFVYSSPIAVIPSIIRLSLNSVMLLSVAVVSLLFVDWGKIFSSLNDPLSLLRQPVFLLVATHAGVIGLGLAYSLLVQPILSFRASVVLFPATALLVGAAVDGITKFPQLAHGLLMLSVLVSSVRLTEWGKPREAEWRQTSAEVASTLGCTRDPIPVSGLDQRYVLADERVVFHGHYFPRPFQLRLIPQTETPENVAKKIMDWAPLQHRTCPILLWNVTNFKLVQIEAIAAALRERTSCRIWIKKFPHFRLALLTSQTPTNDEEAHIVYANCSRTSPQSESSP